MKFRIAPFVKLLVLSLLFIPLFAVAQDDQSTSELIQQILKLLPISQQAITLITGLFTALYLLLMVLRRFISPGSKVGQFIALILQGWQHPTEVQAKVEKSAPPKSRGFMLLRLSLVLTVVCGLVLGVVVRADGPFTICLKGCPDKSMAKATGDTQLNDVLWLGPSVGIDMATRYSGDNTWTAGFVPGVGYGIKLRPQGWTFSDNALAIDLFISAGFTGGNGISTFDMRIEPVVTFVDWISIGIGHRWLLSSTAGVPDQGGTLISFGIRKALGSP